jgi:hypothetical protein
MRLLQTVLTFTHKTVILLLSFFDDGIRFFLGITQGIGGRQFYSAVLFPLLFKGLVNDRIGFGFRIDRSFFDDVTSLVFRLLDDLPGFLRSLGNYLPGFAFRFVSDLGGGITGGLFRGVNQAPGFLLGIDQGKRGKLGG